MQPARPPHRFRRRLLAVMLACALLPLALLGLGLWRTSAGALSLTLLPLEPVLERAQVAARGRDAAQEEELRAARLNLWQVELARRSLERGAPWLVLAALAATALLAAAASLVLARAVVRPVERLTEAMARVGGGALAERVPESAAPEGQADELELLSRQFNRMTAELEAQRERLRVTENLAAWQDVARGLAHELKNPLTALKLGLARLSRTPSAPLPPEEQTARLAEITGLLAGELEVLLRMTDGFSQFAKLPPPSRARLELGALLHDVCGLWRAGSPVPIDCAAEACALVGDADQLRRLFGNLLKNAVEASAGGKGPIAVTLRTEPGRVHVSVADRGAGIDRPRESAEMLRSLGSTKPGGSGLGLPIACKLAHDHGGGLRLVPRDGGGCEAQVTLPLSDGEES